MRGRLADLRFESSGAVVIAALDGEVDGSNARELLAALSSGVPGDAWGLVLDLAGLSYLDSSGVEMVFRLANRLGDRRQRLSVVVPEGAPIARVLDISGVASVAGLTASVDAAIEGIGA